MSCLGDMTPSFIIGFVNDPYVSLLENEEEESWEAVWFIEPRPRFVTHCVIDEVTKLNPNTRQLSVIPNCLQSLGQILVGSLVTEFIYVSISNMFICVQWFSG